MDTDTDRPSTAFTTSKVLALATIGWLGFMTYLTWGWFSEGYLNAVLPVWNAAFLGGIVLIVIQLFRHREWARRWLQGATLCTAIMNFLTAMKPGGDIFWIGVTILGLCGWSLHVAREDYGARDDGTPPGPLARALGMAALAGTILIAVAPSSMLR